MTFLPGRRALLKAAGATVLPGGRLPPAAPAPRSAASAEPLTRHRLRQHARDALRQGRFVSVAVSVRDGRRVLRASAGTREAGGEQGVPEGASFRVCSVTKSFVATVVLQLVAEGRLSLRDSVDSRLPGLVRGNGNDGRRLTLRNLLQHTSGLPEFLHISGTAAEFEQHRFRHVTPRQLLATALRHEPGFPPADPDDADPRWSYSNTNYVLLGLLIERVTGRPWAAAVRDQIIRPLKLTGTYEPGDDPTLGTPHAHAYHRFAPQGTWTDTTLRNMTTAGAAGSLISTAEDLDRFYTALLTGRLLPAAALDEMRRTVPAADKEIQAFLPGMRYGLGLMSQPLPCGGLRWGHGGDLEGTTVRVGVTDDAHRSVVITTSGTTADAHQRQTAERALQHLTTDVLCARRKQS
ncbi:serine hydrolase domain-containing protein [Streptomyces sp. NPDC002446]